MNYENSITPHLHYGLINLAQEIALGGQIDPLFVEVSICREFCSQNCLFHDLTDREAETIFSYPVDSIRTIVMEEWEQTLVFLGFNND